MVHQEKLLMQKYFLTEDAENYDYEKQEAVKHFKKLISISTIETLERILKFAKDFPIFLHGALKIKYQ